MVNRADSPFFIDVGQLLGAVLGHVSFLSAFPAWSILNIDRRMGAFKLLMFLAAVGAPAWCFSAVAGPTAVPTTWLRLASKSRIAATLFHEGQ